MDDPGIAGLLDRLRSADAPAAWEEFLREYSSLMYQVARAYTADEDAAAECYLSICEHLARSDFRRLLKFKHEGSATFVTWLRVVSRNLCFDWHRKKIGRRRRFKSLLSLSALDLDVYDCRFERGLSVEETLQRLCPTSPGFGPTQLAEAERRIERCLNSKQRWILSTRQRPLINASPVLLSEDAEEGVVLVADTALDQESLMVGQEQSAQLRTCVARLAAEERLLLQLRFERELSFEEIARVTGLGDAQRAHRHLGAILKKLRTAMK